MRTPLDHLVEDATRLGFRALNSVVVPLVKSGVASPPPLGVGLVVLETTGRKTGEPRQVPLLATRLGKHVNVSTVRAKSQWVRNLQADPEANLWVHGRKRPATASIEPGNLNVANLVLN
ncbi:MAG: nitroreductase family deazaflavin-dependent oxidoreductase [Acidimicrobiales bacterium]|nr:nitroreductase family deazaflavin-dependent oxidoreductase [Acidimicrobiales bacterium]